MFGAIVGDIVGSVYEFSEIMTKNFPFFAKGCDYTDDSIMSIAVAQALLDFRREGTPFSEAVVLRMREFGRRYPHPMGAYGGGFARWLRYPNLGPYNSWGNGSAMRVSACAYAAHSLEEALELAKQSAEVTHNHPEGIKGAQAACACAYLARTGRSKEEIRAYVQENFYPLDKTMDQWREEGGFNDTCQGTVPPAIESFLSATDYEDAIRNSISTGGDADTIACITGGIAEAYFGVPEEMKQKAIALLPEDLLNVVLDFEAFVEAEKA